MSRPALAVALAVALVVTLAGACGGGRDWVDDAGSRRSDDDARGRAAYVEATARPAARPGDGALAAWGAAPGDATGGDGERAAWGPADDGGAPVVIRSHGAPARPKTRGPRDPFELGKAPATATPASIAPGLYRNTYYDFPVEGAGRKERLVFDAKCAPIANVTRDFHDAICVQGSGRLASGATVSFASRGCSCAELCPRTQQRICFEKLDPKAFPHGRGALGTAIAPLRTLAVDSSVIPLGTVVYIPEFDGTPRADGTRHDGCFVAEDRGLKVIGQHVDVFAGAPAETRRLGGLVPSNKGVHVRLGDAKCRR